MAATKDFCLKQLNAPSLTLEGKFQFPECRLGSFSCRAPNHYLRVDEGEIVMQKRLFLTGVAAVTIFAIPNFVFAQDAGNAQVQGPPAGNFAPSSETPGAAKPLPEVQVIQQNPKPPTPRKKIAARPKPKPVPAIATTPAPMPAEVPLVGKDELPSAVGTATAVKMSPIGGSEIPLDKVPGAVSTVSSSEIARQHSDYVGDALAAQVPGIILSDLQGNAFQTNIDYRGFNSSPVDGVPQGLAVYQNGVRINEAFGDTVNYDFLPTVAINSMTIMSGNPVFGLNAIGGSLSIDMKDGFTYQGFEADARFGSYGRAQGSVQDGMRFGNWATYIALEDIHDDGFRQFGTSDIRRMYADVGVRDIGSEFHLNFTGADNKVGVAAASPVELLDQGWGDVFTTPQSTTNQMEMVALNGRVKASDTVDISGVAYYRHFNQQHVDGNLSNGTPCPILPGGELGACFGNLDGSEVLLQDTNGNNIILPPGTGSLAEIDRTSINSNSFGGSLQAVNKARLFDHRNQFLVGGSIDHGEVEFRSSAELATTGPGFIVNGGLGFVGAVGTGCDLANPADEADGCTPNGTTNTADIGPVSVKTRNTYYGLYFADTFDATDRLTLTVGGRFNVANIQISDQTGLASELNSDSTYWRFNPMVGGTYKLFDGISIYTSYSEANRAPVAAELACADPNNPCLLPSFLTSDPPLKQVVSHTVEAGLRGEKTNILSAQKIAWSAGYFRTLNTNDITNITSAITGRSSFANAGDTLRQGLEIQINYWSGSLFAYMGYNFIDATFQNDLTLSSTFSPSADADGNIFVHPGDRLPGVPAHKFKAGFDYGLTPRWRFGADLIAASDQIFFGDESNQNKPLGGYAKVNLHTSYDVTDHVQIYGLVDNLFDAHYGVYGTYFDVAASNDTFGTAFLDPRSTVPAPPITAYGGVKVRF